MLKSNSTCSGQGQGEEKEEAQGQVHGQDQDQLDPSTNNTNNGIVGSAAKSSDGNGSDGSGDGSGTGSGSGTATTTTGESSRDSDMENTTDSGNLGYWSGTLPSPREDIQMNISVTRTADGMPKFFSCALALIDNKSEWARSLSTASDDTAAKAAHAR